MGAQPPNPIDTVVRVVQNAGAMRPEVRADDDAGVLRELEAVPLGLPAGLEVEWLGVSGYRLTFEGVSLIVDPYVSRASLLRLVLGRPALSDPALLERYVRVPGAVAGVLVGHTHFDHAVDAPAVARRFGCAAYGSASLAHLMRLHGLGAQAVEVEPGRVYELGPFAVRFVPSRHSKLILGRRVPFDGELTCEHLHDLSPAAYKCGQVWGIRIEVAGTSLYHQGSANLADDALGHEPVDVFLAGVAGRSFTPHYWRRILPKLDPRVVVPTHYDDFFRALDRGFRLSRGVHLAEVPAEIGAVSSSATVAALRAPSRS
jgi:L-ascorbate metabolism protein UlaG (beta-lactamase superfamily)